MSLLTRFFGRACLIFMSKVVGGQKYLLPRGPGCNRMRFKKPLVLQCQNYTFSSVPTSESCWNCGQSERKAEFFCKDCNALQKPNTNYNFFHLFGVNESFDIDRSDLSKRFHQLQTALHPDKFSNATDEERSYSAELSSLVNKAFHTLSDPLERGNYLLSLQGSPVLEENTSFNKAFLLEIMELNEELESIETLNEIKAFHLRNKEMITLIQQKVSKSFASQDTLSARASLMEMKYFATLEEKIKERMLQLDVL